MTGLQCLVITDSDDVAVALSDLRQGMRVRVKKGESLQEIELVQDIPVYHKFALRAIKNGEKVLKYGEVIGEASRDITAGSHVHVHNLNSTRG